MAIEINDHIRRHLTDDIVGWLTTVTPSGRPAPRPIWFYWDGETILIYSLNTGAKLRHIAANNHVSLHFTGGNTGSDVVVISGTAALDPTAPPPSKQAALVAKYAPRVADMGQTFDWYDANYGTALRITPQRVWEIGR
jgi:PPOX class probable F420-dependent enzyme